MIAYLDSSAVIKRYLLEDGTREVQEVYRKALDGEATLAFSAWNVGEVLGVLDRYRRRGWLEEEDYRRARGMFILETKRLIRLNLLKIVPVKTRLLVKSWRLVEERHVYQADAIQIVSAKRVGADLFMSGDHRLVEIAREEGLNAVSLG